MAGKILVAVLMVSSFLLPLPSFADETLVEPAVAGKRHASSLSVDDVVMLLHREGFAEIDRVKVEGGVYVANATRPNGSVFRVRVDPADGRLVALDRVGWSRGPDMRNYGALVPSL